MALARDSLILALVLFAAPALALAPAKPHAKAPAKPAPAPVSVPLDPTDLIAEARDAQAKGDSQLALRLAQSAIVADPTRPSSYDALGDLYAANGQAEFARFYYGEALAIDPSDAAAAKAVAALDQDAVTAKANPPNP